MKPKAKAGKHKIVVEGESDKIFIHALLKELNLTRKYDIQTSCQKGAKCEILNDKSIKKIVESTQDLGYAGMIILIDKNTTFADNQKLDCLIEVRNRYLKDIIDGDNRYTKVIVADDELECWEILAFDEYKKSKNCISEAQKRYSDKSKIKIAQKATKKMKDIVKYRAKNRSFDYFIKVIDES